MLNTTPFNIFVKDNHIVFHVVVSFLFIFISIIYKN